MTTEIQSFPPLTPREKLIIKELADGLSSKEIAVKLGITNDTAEAHRHNLMKKTKCRNTTHIVATALRNGIIS